MFVKYNIKEYIEVNENGIINIFDTFVGVSFTISLFFHESWQQKYKQSFSIKNNAIITNTKIKNNELAIKRSKMLFIYIFKRFFAL